MSAPRRPALDHLLALGVLDDNGRVEVDRARPIRESRLWQVGYGDWTGLASATLIGVTRTVRSTVNEVVEYVSSVARPDV